MASLQKKKHYQISLIRDEVKRYIEALKHTIDVCNAKNIYIYNLKPYFITIISTEFTFIAGVCSAIKR